nr:hypothetical protein [uncultured Rhodopila sp.]
MITIAVERTAPVTPRSLIDRIWSGVEWRLARSGVEALAIDYDDGFHQSVQVCVGWRTGHLAMSVMRYRESMSRISYFYSRPPNGVAKQTGLWEARPAGGGCRLLLMRTMELVRGSGETDSLFRQRETAHGEMLRQHLGLTLDVVAEGQG